MHQSITALLLTVVLSSATFAQTVPGNAIHEFSLNDLSQMPHTPGQYRGKVLLLFLLGHN